MPDDFCKLVNNIITWRAALGDVISTRDYVDFSVPRQESELSLVTEAVNRTFESFGQDMRVGHESGVIVPRVK